MFSVRGPKLKIFASIIAVIAIAAGIYLTFVQSRGFVKTTATIVAVREDASGADNSVVYYPTVEYTVNGQTYTGDLNEGSGSYRVGKTISVRYDPDNPSVVHPSAGFGIYILVIGVVILAVIVFSSIREKKSQKEIRALRETRGQTGYAPSVQGEEREVSFLTDTGTPKYGPRIEDASRRVLYEAKMTKFSLTTPYGFDFIDHEHGTCVPHLVGHEEQTDWGNSFLLDNNSTFELDGEDIWKHLRRHGISADTERREGTIFPRYRVMRDGVEIAVIESSSQYVHEEDAEAHSVANKIAVPGFYRIWTREENLDAVFVTAMAFGRSGALNDEGGTFGKMFRQSFRK